MKTKGGVLPPPTAIVITSFQSKGRVMAHVKKAEKSRVHAKQRRTEEAKEIADIAELLPLPGHITKKLDKGSVLRLAITFLRLKQYVGEDQSVMDIINSNVGEGDLMLESLSGFFLIVSAQQDIIYVSENVEKHMGLNQVDMLGKDVYEFILDKDHAEFKKQFVDKYQGSNIHGMGLGKKGEPVEMDIRYSTVTDCVPTLEQRRQFFLRMKCSYQRRPSHARCQPTVSSTHSDFVLLQLTGYVHYDSDGNLTFLAAVARPLQPTPIMELKMDGNMFISRHSLDLRFMYCDPRLSTMLGYEPDEMSGSSMYRFNHPSDLEMCGNCHNDLMTAGTSISKYYRFLSKHNEWCWLQTRATIVYNTSKHPQYIVCMNYIVSEREGRRYLMEHLAESDKTYASTQTSNTKVPSPSVGSASPSSQQSEYEQPTNPVQDLMSPMSGIQLSDTSSDYEQQHHHPQQSQQHQHQHPQTQQLPQHPQQIQHQPQHQQLPQEHQPLPHEHQQLPQQHFLHQASHTSPQQSSSLESSPAHVPQYPSPTSSYGNEPSPTFYLPQHVKPEDQPSPSNASETDLALGNLWLSVHSMVDPSNHSQSEIVPPSLAEEMEDISFEHCHRLMNEATMNAVNTYSNAEYRAPRGADNTVQDWDTCERLVDMQAINMFKKFKTGMQSELVKKSLSSSSLSSSHIGDKYSQSSPASSGNRQTISRDGSTFSSEDYSSIPHLIPAGSSGFMANSSLTDPIVNQQVDEDPVLGSTSHLQYPPVYQDQLPVSDAYSSDASELQMPPPAFGELANLDDILQSFRIQAFDWGASESGGGVPTTQPTRSLEVPQLSMPVRPTTSSSAASMSMSDSRPSYRSLVSDLGAVHQGEPYGRSTQSLMSLTSNISLDNLQDVNAMLSDTTPSLSYLQQAYHRQGNQKYVQPPSDDMFTGEQTFDSNRRGPDVP